VLLLTQNLFHQDTNSRDISLNAKYLVLFKNVRDKKQFLYLHVKGIPKTVTASKTHIGTRHVSRTDI